MIEVGRRFAMIGTLECHDWNSLSIDSDLAPDTSEAAIETKIPEPQLPDTKPQVLLGCVLCTQSVLRRTGEHTDTTSSYPL